MAVDRNTPLTRATLEEFFGNQSGENSLSFQMKELSVSLNELTKEIITLKIKIAALEAAEIRHQVVVSELSSELKKAVENFGKLQTEVAVDRVKVGGIFTFLAMVVSGIVSSIVSYLAKAPAK